MGVPSFFGWLLRNFRGKILSKQLNAKCDHFVIDANCLFHPECNKIKEAFPTIKVDDLERKMFQRIKNYLTYLFNFVNAKKINGTFVDGPAPLAKMVQQRKRRYKAIDDTAVRNEIKRKYGKTVNNNWNNTVITPGTVFMEKLHQELLDYFKNIKFKGKHIYSSYHTNGEGEHKLLQLLKKTVKPDEVVVIYGLDADLIFLAMTSGIENIYLLRESLQLGIKIEENELYDPVEDVAQELMYVSIKEIKNAFNEELWNLIQQRGDFVVNFDKNTDFSNDLVVVCFLLGNDFLPHFPSININKGGLDVILDAYIECLSESTILMTKIENGKLEINSTFFALLIEKLGEREELFFREGLPYHKSRLNKRLCPHLDDYSKEIWALDNMKIFKIDDPIKLGVGFQDVWKFNYYEHHFGASEHQQECIDELVRLYLEGIMWVGKYYFESCPNFMWQYPYDHAPFLSDIATYLRKYNVDMNNFKFDLNNSVTPMVQLLAVLPPASNDMIATSYKSLVTSKDSPILDMYPKKTKLDMLYKDQYWQCIPKLPILDIDRIIDATKEKKLTKEEKVRNEILDNFVFEKNLKI